MPFYEKGPVRIRYEETGSGLPLLVIPGGGLNATIGGLKESISPFDPMEEFLSIASNQTQQFKANMGAH